MKHRVNVSSLGGLAMCAALTVLGCGGSSNASGLTAGGVGGIAGGAPSGGGGTGGDLPSGGAGGGAAGTPSGGAGGVAATCALPSDLSQSSLCVTYEPDNVQFAFDPGFDGLGQFVVQVFDYPDPPDNASDYIAQQLIPDTTSGGLGAIGVTALPVVRFDGLPSKVYVKSIFVDNPLLAGGIWLGGYDLSGGFVAGLPLTEIDLTPGASASVTQHLWAVRFLRVALTLGSGVTPGDDGIGPAAVGIYNTATPAANATAFGFGTAACLDVSGGKTANVDSIFVGTGDFWISAALNDFNGPNVWGPGSLVSLDVDRLPAANRIHVTTQYRMQQDVQLTTVLPVGAPAPAPYTCTP